MHSIQNVTIGQDTDLFLAIEVLLKRNIKLTVDVMVATIAGCVKQRRTNAAKFANWQNFY